MARAKKVEENENINEKETKTNKETVSMEDFKALQEQMKQMMDLLNSKQNEIEELKNSKQPISDNIQENDYVTIRNVSTGSVVVGTRNN